MNQNIITRLAISPSKQRKNLEAKVCPLGGFPFITLRGVPERGFSAATGLFRVVPAHHAEPSLSQAQVFSFSVN